VYPVSFYVLFGHLAAAVKCKVAASTQKQAFNSLLFLYRHALKIDFGRHTDIPPGKEIALYPDGAIHGGDRCNRQRALLPAHPRDSDSYGSLQPEDDHDLHALCAGQDDQGAEESAGYLRAIAENSG